MDELIQNAFKTASAQDQALGVLGRALNVVFIVDRKGNLVVPVIPPAFAKLFNGPALATPEHMSTLERYLRGEPIAAAAPLGVGGAGAPREITFDSAKREADTLVLSHRSKAIVKLNLKPEMTGGLLRDAVLVSDKTAVVSSAVAAPIKTEKDLSGFETAAASARELMALHRRIGNREAMLAAAEAAGGVPTGGREGEMSANLAALLEISAKNSAARAAVAAMSHAAGVNGAAIAPTVATADGTITVLSAAGAAFALASVGPLKGGSAGAMAEADFGPDADVMNLSALAVLFGTLGSDPARILTFIRSEKTPNGVYFKPREVKAGAGSATLDGAQELCTYLNAMLRASREGSEVPAGYMLASVSGTVQPVFVTPACTIDKSGNVQLRETRLMRVNRAVTHTFEFLRTNPVAAKKLKAAISKLKGYTACLSHSGKEAIGDVTLIGSTISGPAGVEYKACAECFKAFRT